MVLQAFQDRPEIQHRLVLHQDHVATLSQDILRELILHTVQLELIPCGTVTLSCMSWATTELMAKIWVSTVLVLRTYITVQEYKQCVRVILSHEMILL